MPELALLCWLLYGAGALGVRIAIHARRTGSSGLVGIRSKAGTARWMAEMTHTAAIALGLAAPFLALAGVLEPIAALDHGWVYAFGLVTFAIGLSGVVVGQTQMGDSWRIGTDPAERTALATRGLFSLVRNPIYSALVPTLLGLALLVPSILALSSVLVFIAAVEIETRLIEEPHLYRAHGKEYARYAARVGRFLPGVGLLSDPPAGSTTPPASECFAPPGSD